MASRNHHTTLLTAIILLQGCSTYSATVIKYDNDAGAPGGAAGHSSTAGASAIGGAGGESTTTAGASSLAGAGGNSMTSGGGSAIGGSTSIGGTGGNTSTAAGANSIGGTSIGGMPTTGGAPNSVGGTGGGVSVTGGQTGTAIGGATATGGAAIGGTISSTDGSVTGGASAMGGSSGCTSAAQCDDGDPCDGTEACSNGKCVAGTAPCTVADTLTCSASCSASGSSAVCSYSASFTATKCATPTCAQTAISGFWDSSNVAHIAYGWNPVASSYAIHLQALNNDGTSSGAPSSYAIPSATGAVGMLSAAYQSSKVALLWSDAETVSSSSSNAARVAITDTNGTASASTLLWAKPQFAGLPYITSLGSGNWFLAFVGEIAPGHWYAATGASFTMTAGAYSPPYPYSGAGVAVVGSTTMLAGQNCTQSSNCTSLDTFSLARFSASDLTSLGPEIPLSQSAIAGAQVAMGPLFGKMAVFWNETASTGKLFRALLNEDGTFAILPTSVTSSIVPKAVVQSAAGGALLIGVLANGSTFQLEGQRLDGSLNLVSSALPLDSAASVDASDVQLHLSPDGNTVLLTYQQAGAKYRIMGSNFCSNP